MDKVWVVYMEVGMDDVKVYDDKVYINKETAENVAEALNRGSMEKFYVDCLDVDHD